MTQRILSILTAVSASLAVLSCRTPAPDFPEVSSEKRTGWFPLASETEAAPIRWDAEDFPVVGIAAGLLSDDVERVTGRRPETGTARTLAELPDAPAVVAGTIGRSSLVDALVKDGRIRVDDIRGRWESFLVETVGIPGRKHPLLVVAGSDRRGTAYGLTSLCGAAGVSPWYWWADVTPERRDALYVMPGRFSREEPSVQYRGIFINDERFGGWARWAEQTFDAETGKVGPKTYEKVFELLLRLKGNLLWPAMHPGTQAFNDDPENARLADDYAIVMGSSHCEQMLRNNEGEWKAVGTWGDFNYITNRDNMIRYWETRVQTNGRYENIYTLGLRGIHDYPMEGANTTAERVALMQKAIDDQRDILRRNVETPVEEVPQVLCTYEEVLEAYHNGLKVPDDVTLLWSDDKHGYTRNLCNPEEMKHPGGAGIYYHISYHGDPASWIWLSPLSPAFISTELTKAYTFGARKIWVFNVGDIKPAEKEISFAMDLAWDIDKWAPEKAHAYMGEWFSRIFGTEAGAEMAAIQEGYYRLMAAGKDSHVWFVDYTENDVQRRIDTWNELENRALQLEKSIPEPLRAAYFELLLYPVRGASLANRYQLLSRRSMARAAVADDGALEDARAVTEAWNALNEWTKQYNEGLLGGKWNHFFSWQPYHWFRSGKMDAPVATDALLEEVRRGPAARFVSPDEALSPEGAVIDVEAGGDVPIWIEALTPIRNFSKAAADNEFCTVSLSGTSFVASATPINNVWHAPYVGPMWSKVGTLHLQKGENRLNITDLKPDARIDRIFVGLWPPFQEEPAQVIPAHNFQSAHAPAGTVIRTVPGLGFSDGLLVQPFDTPSYEVDDAPYVDYALDLPAGKSRIEIRTLANLHVYEGRDIRYAVRVDDGQRAIFSIHAGDFTAEWRKNVLRGYASRSIPVTLPEAGRHRVSISFLDPGLVLEEIRVYSPNRTL
ncbi:MAG: glycosyl hydrolase 115 family protein [Bacteroidales bacterium]|nr:glycosyl hydrolase 115 family protein [Bacteroidales bacterium]